MSLKLRLFLILLIVGMLPAFVVRESVLKGYENRAIKVRTQDAQTQLTILANHLITYHYLADPSSEVVNAELRLLSNLYNGRVMVINQDLRIVKDTYGMGERPVAITYMEWLGAYGLMLGTNTVEEDGSIIQWNASKKMFPFLEQMQRWYNAGIIDPEWITDLGDVYWNKIYEGKHGTFLASLPGLMPMEENIRKHTSDAYLVAVPPPTGPDGYCGMQYMGSGAWRGMMLNKNIESPERFIEIYNDMFDEATAAFYMLGEEGVDFELTEDGYTSLATAEQIVEKGIGFFVIDLVPIPNDMNSLLLSKRTNEIIAMYKGKSVKSVTEGITWSDELKELRSEIGDISSMLITGMYSVICGKEPVEAYQNYIDSWWSNGGDRLTAKMNEEYQAWIAEKAAADAE